MILESMTYDEIALTMQSDFKNELWNGYNSCYGMRDKYGKYVEKHVKANEYHYFGYKEKISKNQNKYIFHFYTNGKLEYRKTGIIRNFWLEYLLKDGLHAAKINPHNNNEITFYTPHLFDRFKERFLVQYFDTCEMPKSEVMNHFFLSVEMGMAQPVNNPKYPNSIFVTIRPGVVLGTMITRDIWEYKTFISFDMLKNDQIQLSSWEMDYLEQARYLQLNGKISIAEAYF